MANRSVKQSSRRQASASKKRLPVRLRQWLKRRKSNNPHRSFKLTKRRDYLRSLKLPGYLAFTAEVIALLWRHKRLFIGLVALYAVLVVILGGVSSQNIFGQINELVGEEDLTALEAVIQAGAVAIVGFGGANLTVPQQIFLGAAILLIWLCTVWLLREVMAGRQPKLRDGLYNSGAPIAATAILVVVMLVQLLPIGLLSVAYRGLLMAGLAGEGLGAMLFFAVAALVSALSLYWLTATLLALVVVTLPGMYPLHAWRVASDMVLGRRLKVMYRMIWMLICLMVFMLLVMIPMILLNQWLLSLADWVSLIPLVPAAYALVGGLMSVFSASYIYLLYRKIVAYDAETSR